MNPGGGEQKSVRPPRLPGTPHSSTQSMQCPSTGREGWGGDKPVLGTLPLTTRVEEALPHAHLGVLLC